MLEVVPRYRFALPVGRGDIAVPGPFLVAEDCGVAESEIVAAQDRDESGAAVFRYAAINRINKTKSSEAGMKIVGATRPCR